MADHLQKWSHDTINRYLKGEKLTPRLLFEQVEPLLEPDPEAYLIFELDTVLDKKSFGPKIEVTRKQWSGNEKSVIRGIGVVSCVYVNPKTENFWVIDYRIFDPETDGLSKFDHVEEMLRSAEHRRVPFRTVLMDSWYAAKDLMLLIDGMGEKKEEEKKKTFYCPLKSNRQVDDSGGEKPLTGEWRSWIGARRGAKAGQAHKRDQGLPQELQGEAIPGSGAFSPHGVDRDQRSFSGFDARGARGA
jgi:hypothetical protein